MVHTFGGRYTDEACTKEWSFSSGITGDMTLYAGGTIPTLTPIPAATTVQQTTTPPLPVTGEPTIAPSSADIGEDVTSGIYGNGTVHFLLLLLFLTSCY